MDKVIKQELRRLSEAACFGSWQADALAVIADTRALVCCGPGQMQCCGDADVDGDEFDPVCSTTNETFASFIAAANPAAILSLLDELEQAKSRVAELEIENLPLSMLRTSYQVHKALVEAAGCETVEQLAEQRDSALSDLEQYRKDAERYRRYRLGKVSPELLDAEIDAAMAKEGGANG